MNVWSHRVLDGGGEPADDGISYVLDAEVRILRASRRIPGYDGILKAGRFKCFLPILYAALKPRSPLGGGGRVDIVDDRLDRLGKLSSGILLFQTPAIDVPDPLRAMLVSRSEERRVGKGG